MKLFSFFKKKIKNEPEFDFELEHLSSEDKLLLESMTDEQLEAFNKWYNNHTEKKKYKYNTGK